jgi:hypothetical protein
LKRDFSLENDQKRLFPRSLIAAPLESNLVTADGAAEGGSLYWRLEVAVFRKDTSAARSAKVMQTIL